MKNIVLLISILLTATSSFSQATHGDTDFNLGFEAKGAWGNLPDKWFQWGHNYNVRTDTTTSHSGKFSVLIAPAGEKSPNSFGCIATAIPAIYDGQEIELKAYMKLRDVVDGPIGLMIRIDGNSGTVGFENMQGRNIQGTRDWTLFSVKIRYPENASTIYIGAILSGKGQLWVDDFQLLLDGKHIKDAKIRKSKEFKADKDKEFDNGSGISNIDLTKSKTDDLQLLGQLWGYIKYYHPSVAAGDYNWDYELFRILPKVLAAKNISERNTILDEWVMSLGKIASIKKDTSSLGKVKLKPDLAWVNRSVLGKELTESLKLIKHSIRSDTNYYIGLAPGVGNPLFRNERTYNLMNYSDAGFRLLCLYRYWNIIHYYFPYKNLIEENWNEVLHEYIPKFVNASNELEYKLTTLSLIARIHDTHANIWGGDNALDNHRGLRYSPLEVTFIEDKAVVTNYFDQTLGEKSGIKIGDIIETVDGKPLADILKEKLPITPASNYPTQLRDIARDLLRTNNKALNIQYSNGVATVNSQVETYDRNEINIHAKYQRKDTCFKIIDSRIAYLNPAVLRNEHLGDVMKEIQKSKGLVIDFRCYPADFTVFTLSEYLLPSQRSFVKFSNGSITTPGLFTMTKELKVGRDNPEHYKGKVVIIVNESTQSSAEYHTMAFRTSPNATVIGSTTAGADGNVSRFVLPGGISTMISGIGVYYPDGTETQRIGIVPDIEVKPTVQGVRAGKDELLERAVEIINGR